MNAQLDKIQQIQIDLTSQIVEQLKEYETTGKVPQWLKPSSAKKCFALPTNLEGRAYSGINLVILWMMQDKQGFTSNQWGTFKAIREKGGTVKKGEKAFPIFFYKQISVNELDEQGKPKRDSKGKLIKKEVRMLKYFSVFNMNQTTLQEVVSDEVKEQLDIAKVFEREDMNISFGNAQPLYSPSLDLIRMPYQESYSDQELFWGSLAHEATHWTKHPERLNRSFEGEEETKRALEELTAELGSAFLCAEYGIESTEQDTAYLHSWIQALEGDHRLIFKVAAEASKAHQFLSLSK